MIIIIMSIIRIIGGRLIIIIIIIIIIGGGRVGGPIGARGGRRARGATLPSLRSIIVSVL